jgi:hypothetical protein
VWCVQVEVLLLGELFLCEVFKFFLGPGELFSRLPGSTMFRLPDSPALQLPPKNRNKLVRNDVYTKIVTIMKKYCLLHGSRSSVGPGGAGGALQLRRRCGGGTLRLPSPESLSEEYRKQPTLQEAGMCCSSGEDGEVLPEDYFSVQKY